VASCTKTRIKHEEEKEKEEEEKEEEITTLKWINQNNFQSLFFFT
jgi:hypothetical protein